MHLTSTAEPSVLMRELLWGHELSETIIDSNLVVLGEMLLFAVSCTVWVDFGKHLRPN